MQDRGDWSIIGDVICVNLTPHPTKTHGDAVIDLVIYLSYVGRGYVSSRQILIR